MLQLKKMSSSKPGAKSSEPSEKEEEGTKLVKEEEKPSNGVIENGKESSESEMKKRKKRKFPSKPTNGVKENGKQSSESEPKKRKKKQFPSKEEISSARLEVFSMFDISLWLCINTFKNMCLSSINIKQFMICMSTFGKLRF